MVSTRWRKVKFLVSAMIVLGLFVVQSSKVEAANISAQFNTGDAVSNAASDTWALDNSNKGVATMDLSFEGA